MKVFLTSSDDYDIISTPGWLRSKDTIHQSNCTDNPEEADIIIFVELHPQDDPYFRKVLAHPIFKKYRHKCVMYHDADLSVTPLPTISPSIEKWQYSPAHKSTFHYIARVCENEAINNSVANYPADREYLYSFIGSKTHAIRNKILNSKHPSNTFLKDTTGMNAWSLQPTEKIKYEQEYFEVSNKSYFILAPRGIGPCSYRLFESLQLGRVPVIISDAWVKIPNINWDKFTITIPEAQIHHIPEILIERQNEAVEMGKLARNTCEKHFSPGVSLHKIVAAAEQLLKHPYSRMDSIKEYAQFIQRPWHLRNFLRYKKNQLKRSITGIGN